MKKLIFIAAFAAVALSACGVGGGSLKQDIDTVAYFIGRDLGVQLKATDSTMNPKLIAKGIIDVFENKNMDLTRDSVNAYLQEYFMVRLPEKRKKASEEFLAKVEAENKNVQKTESGLLYEIIMSGDEELKPSDPRDQVKVMYKGTFKTGEEFDSSTDTTNFRLNGVIKGWTEGLQLIGKGGKIKLWVPSDLAYGPYQRGNIGPNEALVFEIDLLDVDPFVEPEADEKK